MRSGVTSSLAIVLLAGLVLSGALRLDTSAAAALSDTVIHQRDGQTIPLSRYRGRWVLINYWATWCGACIEEFPTLNRIATAGRAAVIGLSDEHIQPAAWAAFLAAHPRSYPTALVDRATLPAEIAPTAFFIEMRPISYLLRPDGSLARRFIGAVDPAELEKATAPAK